MPTTTIVEFTGSIDTVSNRTDSAGAAVNPDYKAEERRMELTLLSEGVLSPADGWRPVAGSAATMNVVIGSGSAEVDLAVIRGQTAGQGNYIVRLDEVTKTVALNAADASNPRIDEIYLVVYDHSYDASSRTLPRLAKRTGDAAPSPTAPGPDASWEAYLLLATIDVPASAADILACTITDSRPFSTMSGVDGGWLPVGSMVQYLGSVAPDGFFLAQGQAISRTTYKRLFAKIGTTFGVGDGSTTFNLPDMRQRFPLGKSGSGTGSTLGSTGGSIDHTHTQPTHTHTNPNTATNGDHSHTQGATGAGGSHSHAVASGVVGSSTANTQAAFGTDFSAANSNHTHGEGTLATDTEASHTHTNPSTSTTGNHSHTQGATGSSGGDVTGSNNPPFLVVNYIVKY